MNPIAKYLFALSAVIVAYTAYVKLAVPILEGPPTLVKRQPVAVDYPDVTEVLDKSHLPSIVPPDAWELGSCKTLLTPQGTIYFEYWEPVDDEGTYKLMPFTIVLNDPVNKIRDAEEESPQQKKPSPIVLRSLEGARLRFSKPLTARSKKDDIELESALLDGQVTLFRPANPVNDEDELRIVGRNIQINRTQVFTLSDVDFSVGPHHGSGRNLSIQLTHKTDSDSPTKSFANVAGVEQMELAYVRELVLQPPNSTPSVLANNTKRPVDSNGATISLSNQKSPLQISCEGPFVFNMSQNKAWFRDNVVVTQLDQYRDQLACSSLQIELEKNEKETTIKNLIAVGTPEVPATITSRSQQTLIEGEELTFEVAKSTVRAAGSRPVSIRSPTFAIESPTLEYQLAEAGKLGTLVAEGPGILRGIQKGRRTEPFEVRWDSQLTTRDLDAERVQIDIEERASVKFNHDGIWADNLSLVVWQLPDPAKKESWQYSPSKLNARGNVLLHSSKVSGFTKELVANWPEPKPESAIQRHTVSYRGFQIPQDDFRTLPDSAKTPTLKFKGDRVVANLTGDLDKMQIQDLFVDGSLIVESKEKDRQPFSITGQSMKLVPQANDLYRVTINSQEDQLATFNTNGFDIEGKNLQLDQSANTIWVHGMGNLKVDPRKTLTESTQGKAPKLQGATVSWQGGMVFDGSKIYFEHMVKMLANRSPDSKGLRSRIKSSCEALTLELSKPIQFEKVAGTDAALNKNDAEIRRMVFVNQVNQTKRAFRLAGHKENVSDPIEFQNASLDEDGKIVEMQKLRVPMASFDVEGGDVVTSGPGEAITYQFSNGNNPMSGLNGKKSRTPSARKLTCVHTRFDGSLTANAEDGKMELQRNTRSAWANVKSFEQTLDPDQPGDLPLGAAVLKADVLRFTQWTPRNSKQRREMRAEGNATIQSELFEAVADRMTYNDATDILIIEGRPPAEARLSYRRTQNAQPESLRAAKVKYRLSDQWTDVYDVRSVEAGLSPRKQ